MKTKIKKDYFENKNYIILYIFKFFNKFASSLVNFFTGAFFYSLGMPLHFILLFFAFEFGFRGFFSPLGPSISSKIGITKTIFLSNISYVLFFIFVGLGEKKLVLGFFAFIFHSFSSGLYTTITEGLQSKLINNENRGKQQSLMFILQSIAGLLGITFGTFSLKFFSYNMITIVVGFFLILSSIPFLFLKNFSFGKRYNYGDSFNYLFSSDFKENIFPMFGQALSIIANVTFIPIFIYSKVDDFFSFGIIMFFVLFTEALFIFIFGRLIDKKGSNNLNKKITWFNQSGNIAILLFSKNPFTLAFANVYNQITWNLYFTSALVRQFNKAKKKTFLFMTAMQMILCFVEIFVLSFFTIVAFYFGENVFYLIFLFSIIGVFLFSKYFKD